jgi:DNA-directed RNA polymerase subunit RPC12/RpoP
MFGVIHPPFELSLMYKCQNCGHKFKPLLGIIKPKKCPLCGGKNLKASVGVHEPDPWPLVN